MKIAIPDYVTDRFVPNLRAVELLESFLISAISSLLLIWIYLNLAGFPQIARGNFHIAHMLWGGLFMLLAILFFSAFINSESRSIASILGGIGFGTFIDELGKFITADNNYFYQPTIALIYVIFIILFLLIRWLASITEYSSKTYTANAIDGLRELIIYDLDEDERENALEHLRKSDPSDPVVKTLYALILEAKPHEKKQTYLGKVMRTFLRGYRKTLKMRWVAKLLILYFVVSMLGSLVLSATTSIRYGYDSLAATGYAVSTILSGVFVCIAIYWYARRNRLNTYNHLQRATLIAIFLQQFFLFLLNELSAVVSLITYIAIHSVLNQAIYSESQKHTPSKSI